MLLEHLGEYAAAKRLMSSSKSLPEMPQLTGDLAAATRQVKVLCVRADHTAA